MDVDDSCALLRVKKPRQEVPPGLQETYAAALNAHAEKRNISLREHVVREVSVAVPVHVPREIDRHAVIRLGLLVRPFVQPKLSFTYSLYFHASGRRQLWRGI